MKEHKNGETEKKEKTPQHEENQADKIYQFARSNTQDTVAYVILFIGIILLFFRPEWGGILVGAVGGFYYSQEIMSMVLDVNTFIDREGMIRSLILGGLLLAFLIQSIWLFVGLAVGVAIKQILFTTKLYR